MIVAPHTCFDESTAEQYDDIKKFYYSNLHNDFVNFENALNHMIFIQEYCKAKNIKLLYFRSVMDQTLDQKSLMKTAESAYMEKSDPEYHKQGIKYNYEKLSKLINMLDKDIWIKEFWYSMKDHINNNFPGQLKPGYTKTLPVKAVKSWGELVKSCL